MSGQSNAFRDERFKSDGREYLTLTSCWRRYGVSTASRALQPIPRAIITPR
jgi:hypothetical protein